MMPVVFLAPACTRADGSNTHVAFAHGITKPVKSAQFLAAIERALFSQKSNAQAAPPPKTDLPLAERLPLRVLLVDDNSINQKVAARLVQQLGYKPDLAANGKLALDALDAQHYDLVFMDMMMPEMDGLEATRRIRERQVAGVHPNYQSRILIVAMTAHAMAADREKCLAAGMDDYLAKPIRPNDVRGIIEKWGPQIQPQAAATPAPAPKIETAPAPAVAMPKAELAAAVAQPPSPLAGEPPVDMGRLNDLTGSDPATTRELIDMFYKQTAQQLKQLEDALRANDTSTVGHVAHSCKGASATLGMTRFSPIMLQLEKMGKAGALNGAEKLCVDARNEFKVIQDFFMAQPGLDVPPPAV